MGLETQAATWGLKPCILEENLLSPSLRHTNSNNFLNLILIPTGKFNSHTFIFVFTENRDYYRKSQLEKPQESMGHVEPSPERYIFKTSPAPKTQETSKEE